MKLAIACQRCLICNGRYLLCTVSVSIAVMCEAVCLYKLLDIEVKVKQSCYRPGVAQRVPGS